jgi:hypothetical protein
MADIHKNGCLNFRSEVSEEIYSSFITLESELRSMMKMGPVFNDRLAIVRTWSPENIHILYIYICIGIYVGVARGVGKRERPRPFVKIFEIDRENPLHRHSKRSLKLTMRKRLPAFKILVTSMIQYIGLLCKYLYLPCLKSAVLMSV